MAHKTSNPVSLINLPFDTLAYLAHKYLDYSNTINLFEVLILAAFKTQKEILSAQDYAKSYDPRRYSLYRQLLPAQLIATANSSFFFSPRSGWYTWGKNPAHLQQEDQLTLMPKRLNDLVQNNKIKLLGRIITIASSKSRTLFLTASGLYKSGEGFTKTESTQTNVELVQELAGKKILKVVLGEDHAMALIEGGIVYSWGVNTFGQLGLGDSIASCDAPKIIETLKKEVIKDIFAGENSSFCLTEDGKVYAFGANEFGQLGLGNVHPTQAIPQLVNGFSEPISQISCGGMHTLFLSATGKVFSCGSNTTGKLGLGANYFHQKLVAIPTELKSLPTKIKKIAAGKTHSLCLTIEGELYGFGSNQWNKLDLDGRINSTPTPKFLTTFTNKIIDMTIGQDHSLCLDQQGTLYSFGSNTWGVLGHDAELPSKIVNIPDLNMRPMISMANPSLFK